MNVIAGSGRPPQPASIVSACSWPNITSPSDVGSVGRMSTVTPSSAHCAWITSAISGYVGRPTGISMLSDRLSTPASSSRDCAFSGSYGYSTWGMSSL
jgi:hypothetical protein